jgi:hypothetical protein
MIGAESEQLLLVEAINDATWYQLRCSLEDLGRKYAPDNDCCTTKIHLYKILTHLAL